MNLTLNLTSSLANTKSLLQVGVSEILTWNKICDAFQQWHHSNIRDSKDTLGFTLGNFKKYTAREWRVKLYDYYLDLEEKVKKIENFDAPTKSERSTIYKYSMVNTEENRLTLLQELFPQDSIHRGFHRVARDIITKEAIILDIDNKQEGLRPSRIIQPHEILKSISSVNYIAYSSYSNTAEHPKFRVIIPANRPFTSKENNRLRHYFMLTTSVRKNFDYIQGLVDVTCFEPARFFYVPVNNSLDNAWCNVHDAKQFFSVDNALKKYSHIVRKPHMTWGTMKTKLKQRQKEAASA